MLNLHRFSFNLFVTIVFFIPSTSTLKLPSPSDSSLNPHMPYTTLKPSSSLLSSATTTSTYPPPNATAAVYTHRGPDKDPDHIFELNPELNSTPGTSVSHAKTKGFLHPLELQGIPWGEIVGCVITVTAVVCSGVGLIVWIQSWRVRARRRRLGDMMGLRMYGGAANTKGKLENGIAGLVASGRNGDGESESDMEYEFGNGEAVENA